MERVKGFEPSTSTLARLRSTPELHPLLQTTFPTCVSSLFCIDKNVRHIHARFGAAQTKNDSWTKASTHRECSVLHWQERPTHPCAFWSSADQKRLVDESLDAPRMLGSALARTSDTSMRVLEQRRPKTTRGRKLRRRVVFGLRCSKTRMDVPDVLANAEPSILGASKLSSTSRFGLRCSKTRMDVSDVLANAEPSILGASRLSFTSRFWSALLQNAHGCAGRSCQCRTEHSRCVEAFVPPRMLDVGRGRVERPGRRTRCGLTNPPAELYTDASWMFSDVSGMFLFFDP